MGVLLHGVGPRLEKEREYELSISDVLCCMSRHSVTSYPLLPCLSWCLRVSIAVKDHGNSYEGKPFNWAVLQFRGLVHYHHDGIWLCTDRHGTGEVPESPVFCRHRK